MEITKYIDKAKVSLFKNAVRKYNQDDFLQSAIVAISSNNKLQECLATVDGQRSLYNALSKAALTGLSLNPALGYSCLVAYKGKASYQVMKNGLIKLAMDSGKVLIIKTGFVREKDKFDIQMGLDSDTYNFKPALKSRGDIIGFFAAVRFTNNETDIKYMSIEEMEEHRDSYSEMYKYKPEFSPWKKSFEGMGVKTILKVLFRNVSLSEDMSSAISTDDSIECEVVDQPDEKKGSSALDVIKKIKEEDDE